MTTEDKINNKYEDADINIQICIFQKSTYNFQPDSLAQTAHHCQVPELKKGKQKQNKQKTRIKISH